ncbi:hypothetical protein GCM10009795_018210 [Nocardioides hankookensis]|uniref:Uncharacterized protein n=1 Tax=Nocardioides hankookensis TaxID=443157 RepID=A0ABW1LJ77_9ACTN
MFKGLLQGVTKVLVVTIAAFCVLIQVSNVDHAVTRITDRAALTSLEK